MLRLILRFLGLCLMAAGFVTLIVDVTRSLTSGKLHITTIGERATEFFPDKLALMQDAVEHHLHPLLWDPILVDFQRLPIWVVAAIIGALMFRLARKPAPKFGFSSR
jgi:hypothetical protein